MIGPVYEDPFRIELGAFLESVFNGTPNKTTLDDSLADLKLIAEIGQHFRT